jgi:hypothetical protein
MSTFGFHLQKPNFATEPPGLSSTAIIRRIAELKYTIAAVLALIEERQGSR